MRHLYNFMVGMKVLARKRSDWPLTVAEKTKRKVLGVSGMYIYRFHPVLICYDKRPHRKGKITMINEKPEEWGDPLRHLFKEPLEKFENLFGPMPTFEDETIKVRLPSGTVIEMPRREFDSKVAIGLSLTEVEE